MRRPGPRLTCVVALAVPSLIACAAGEQNEIPVASASPDTGAPSMAAQQPDGDGAGAQGSQSLLPDPGPVAGPEAIPEPSEAIEEFIPTSEDDIYYRTTSVRLVRPRVYADATSALLALNGDVAGPLNEALVSDEAPEDGYADLSPMVKLDRFDPEGPGGIATVMGALCPLTDGMVGVEACSLAPDIPSETAAYTNRLSEDCMPARFSGLNAFGNPEYQSAPVEARCLLSEEKELLSWDLGTFGQIQLQSAEVAARYGETYTDGFPYVVVNGFLPESVADATMLPDDIPQVAQLLGFESGNQLSQHLSQSDKEDDGGVPGWWFTIELTAAPIKYQP